MSMKDRILAALNIVGNRITVDAPFRMDIADDDGVAQVGPAIYTQLQILSEEPEAAYSELALVLNGVRANVMGAGLGDWFYLTDETINDGAGGFGSIIMASYPASGRPVFQSKPPANATAPGHLGEVTFDDNYIYRCVADNTWKRVAISTW